VADIEDGRGRLREVEEERLVGRLFTNLNLRLFVTSTTTVLVTSTISATTLSYAGTCIQYAVVADAAAAASVCRRRRHLAEFDDLLANYHQSVEPSQVAPVAVSAVAELRREARELLEDDPMEAVKVESSRGDENGGSYENYAVNRALLTLTTVLTVTSTVPSGVISVSVVTKTLGTDFAAAAKIKCIPEGYYICG